jgi:hypothetical protein
VSRSEMRPVSATSPALNKSSFIRPREELLTERVMCRLGA